MGCNNWMDCGGTKAVTFATPALAVPFAEATPALAVPFAEATPALTVPVAEATRLNLHWLYLLQRLHGYTCTRCTRWGGCPGCTPCGGSTGCTRCVVAPLAVPVVCWLHWLYPLCGGSTGCIRCVVAPLAVPRCVVHSKKIPQHMLSSWLLHRRHIHLGITSTVNVLLMRLTMTEKKIQLLVGLNPCPRPY